MLSFNRVVVQGMISTGLLFLTTTAVFAEKWVPGQNSSCLLACQAAGRQAITTGKYTNGKHFAICRANANGEGWRPGFNLEPNWANRCYVPIAAERPEADYQCLCR